jgi:hypothetical protein
MAKFSVSSMPGRTLAQQAEKQRLEAVIGAGRIARCGTNTAIGLADEILIAELLVGSIAP